MPKDFLQALEVFRKTAETVPAYKDFLKKHKVDPHKVKTPEDFRAVPCVDKKNYLRYYNFRDLFPDRKIPAMVSVSSGSSGEPFYWPRGREQEIRGGKVHERILRDMFDIKEKRILVIVCFSMGTWVAGTFTTTSCRWVADQGYNLSTISPGIDLDDALAVLKKFASNFESVIITGYPPFVMDLVHKARHEGLDLPSMNLRLLLAGENISEKWRDAIHNMCGITEEYAGSCNIYGTADATVLGHETPLSVFIRRQAKKNKDLFNSLFGSVSYTPSFVQYYSDDKYFEVVDDKLVFTTNSGIPLVRYNINDIGRIFTFSEIEDMINQFGIYEEAARLGLLGWKDMPFLSLTERGDVSATFYALNIYPENIKSGLEDDSIIKYVTGKFVINIELSEDHTRQIFKLAIELAESVEVNNYIYDIIYKNIVSNLIALNAEYRKLHDSIGDKSLPELTLLPNQHPLFEITKSKYRWVED